MGEPEEDGGGLLSGQPRWVRIGLIASAMVVPLCFIGLFLFEVIAASRETGWTGSRGGALRIPVLLEQVRPVLIVAGVLFLAMLAVLFARILRVAWRAADPSGSHAAEGLKLGERVVWTARPGWQTLTGSRALVLSLTALTPVLIGWWFWRIVTGEGVWPRAFWALLLIGLLFGSIVPAILLARRMLSNWVLDALGNVAVTDRRIVWLSPVRGAAYREIAGDSIIGAALVDRKGRRGWVSVTQQVGGDVREHDLFGLPDPEQAVAAIEALSLAQAREVRFPAADRDLGA
ncbi:hypothetical protein CA223_03490 [Sphingomonas koreensis]|jgi:hypothetical protein|uniref:Uncharacterized protein n=1 Tax=Sphingomonas koreensis TaxID=93064 RepID=A0A1L6JDS5_9SPHN|nr:hypothetical protein [Sphingomonas koreensis]APR54055.1 hypothetical protein BRX40_18000 [Sphingomonas koreensis]MDC7809027.1 hypothetical protein [Sphingomonas koreensis]RSU18689.1 hypothetical protein CA224_14740 [Sphingomonas koreensis]RSU25464.1 hypothetical protein CA222_11745 [Sphingomonas koreensis]RSU25799.1 hypothetical protein CA225_15250 [Sphingomonas koreensis]